MKKAIYKRNVNCTMSEEMFQKVEKITIEKEISFSEFIRQSIELKLRSMEESKSESV
jgi:hypothetical protein